MLDKELILFHPKCKSAHQVIKILGNKLYQKGFVTEGYTQAVIEREEEYPTGLPTEPYGVAIPHVQCDFVLKPAFAVAILNKPIKFRVMGNPTTKVDVQLVILMAIADPNKQLIYLQRIADIFSDGNKINQIIQVKNSSEAYKILQHMGVGEG